MRTGWLILALLAGPSCSDDRAGGNALPAEKAVAGTPPTAQAIIAAGDCEPPPCDDVGACARMPIAEVRDLQCSVGPSGDTARCAFEMVPAFERREERLKETRRIALSLRRRGGDTWCIGL